MGTRSKLLVRSEFPVNSGSSLMRTLKDDNSVKLLMDPSHLSLKYLLECHKEVFVPCVI